MFFILICSNAPHAVKAPTKPPPADPRERRHPRNNGDTVKAPAKHISKDPRELHHLCKEFANTFTELADILNTSVQISKLKEFLKSYCHPLHPEEHFVDPKIYGTATTTKEVLEFLVPQYINYMHYYLLEDIVVTFGCDRAIEILQQYTGEKYSRKRKLEDLPGPTTDREIEQSRCTKKLKLEVEGDTSDATVEIIGEIQKVLEKSTGINRAVITYGLHDKLNSLPGPITDGEIEQFHGTKKLKVELEGDTSDTIVEIIGKIQKALEKATGIKQLFIVYAFNDPGSVLLTFLIPKCILHILHELNTEDLAILADSGVMKLKFDEVVIDNIQRYSTVKRSAIDLEVSFGSGEHTKSTGLEYHLKERVTEISSERYLHLLKMLRTAETAMLNDICAEQFLKTFSQDLLDWKKLASYFSIHEWNIEELVYNYPNENDQKYQALLCWKRAEGSAATYYNLLESLILHGNIGEVEALLQRLGEGNWPNYNNYRMCMSMYYFIATCRVCGAPCQQVAEAAVPGSRQLATVERSAQFNAV